MAVFTCQDCKKEIDYSEETKPCIKCMKSICLSCYENGHFENCKGKGEAFYFVIKLFIGVFLVFFLSSSLTINGSEEMSLDRILFMYGFGAIPFGWHVIEKVQDLIWEKMLGLFGIKVKKRKSIHELTEEDVEKMQKEIVINIILFPTRIVKWLIQALISIPIGMLAFPVSVYRLVRGKK